MFANKQFTLILSELETSNITASQAKLMKKFLINDFHIYEPLFDDYIRKRLNNNIHPTNLLKLASNLEFSNYLDLSKNINNIVVSNVINRNLNYDQLIFMVRHDSRNSDLTIKKELLRQTLNLPSITLEVFAEKMGRLLNISKLDFYLEVLEEAGQSKLLWIMSGLSLLSQYDLLIKAILKPSLKLSNFLSSLEDYMFFDYLKSKLISYGDEDFFAQALINTTVDLNDFELSYSFNSLLKDISVFIPSTIEFLFSKAEKQKMWSYLLILGANKNKKDLLKIINKANDPLLIDRFFDLYKYSAEVRHLVPFI